MTPLEVEKSFIKELVSLYDEAEAAELAFYVINHLNGINRSTYLLQKKNLQINEAPVMNVLNELKTGKPVQYIIGETDFYGLKFKVDPSVLIPRPETEELVDWVVKEVGRRKTEDRRQDILDLGTGSGCIAVSLKKNLPESKVYAVDISADAVEVAKKNAQLNGVSLEFMQADILKDKLPGTKYSIIVSNPPYVTFAEKQSMRANVADHEPHVALFVPDHEPLLFYEKIGEYALSHLLPDGLLFFEINEHYGQQVKTLLEKQGFSDVELRKDLQGKDRMIKAKI